MTKFIIMRVIQLVPTLFAVSLISFFIIQLPPGDYLTTHVANLQAQGESVDPAQIEALRDRYGLDDPFWVQYWTWITNIVLHGDFGLSFQHSQPVSVLIGEVLGFTVILGVATLLLTWAIALPGGVISAMRQHSAADYAISGVGFVALAVPNFLVALVFAYIGFAVLGTSVGGLFSPEYSQEPWSFAKVVDLIEHLGIPVLVISLAGTAGLIRITRANMLDELHKPYVTTARAKGLTEGQIVRKYPLRIALNPFISTVGWNIPNIFDGEVIVATVLTLGTTGPLLLGALQSQDMYLAGGIIFIIAVLTVIGTLLSDILLAAVDPRVRFGRI